MEPTDIALKLLTTSGFDNEFFSNLATCKTHKEAYEKTEELYMRFFKKRRYSGYESYRVVRNLRISKKF